MRVFSLNVGCGSDHFGDLRLDRVHHYLGKNTCANLIADACYLPFRNNSFDHIRAFDVIEHTDNWKTAVIELIRVSKGQIEIRFPQGDGFKQHALASLLSLRVKELPLFALSRKLHKWQINPESFNRFLAARNVKFDSHIDSMSIFNLVLSGRKKRLLPCGMRRILQTKRISLSYTYRLHLG